MHIPTKRFLAVPLAVLVSALPSTPAHGGKLYPELFVPALFYDSLVSLLMFALRVNSRKEAVDHGTGCSADSV